MVNEESRNLVHGFVRYLKSHAKKTNQLPKGGSCKRSETKEGGFVHLLGMALTARRWAVPWKVSD